MLSMLLVQLVFFQNRNFGTLDTGGQLSPVQAAMDSTNLILAVEVFPDSKTIAGYAQIEYKVKPKLESLELELVDGLTVSKVLVDGVTRPFKRGEHKLLIGLEPSENTQLTVKVEYAGEPWEAQNPPWGGGFNWSRTDSGQPWIGVSCQGEGGKVWFPGKTHQVDKYSSVRLEITVPEPLYCAANGLLEKIEPQENKRRTFHWVTRYPIASYNISINIADYQLHTRTYKGAKEMPVIFYALREYQEADQGGEQTYQQKIDNLLDQALDFLDFYATYYGEYPFINEKFGLAHTHYLGMEHQTINSYGNHFRAQFGFDGLMLHEMAHEWWGNKVTAGDLADFWIQEGIGSYMTGDYIEHKQGLDAALKYFQRQHFGVGNRLPLVQGENISASQAYNRDIYNKGSLVIHALRYLLGKEMLTKALYGFANDDEINYNNPASTTALIAWCERVSGRELGWFFKQYVYGAALPKLTVAERDGNLEMAWDNDWFNMPLEVIIIDESGKEHEHRILFNDGKASYKLPVGSKYKVDPRRWIYKIMEHE